MRSKRGAPNRRSLGCEKGFVRVNGGVVVVGTEAGEPLVGGLMRVHPAAATTAVSTIIRSRTIPTSSLRRELDQLPPSASPGSTGRKLKSHASHNVRENGKNKNGNATQSTAATTSINVHGWCGAL